MADAWYYELDGKENGPVDTRTLQVLLDKRVIAPSTLVWAEGLAEWVAVSRVKGLVTTPPPLPERSRARAPSSPVLRRADLPPRKPPSSAANAAVSAAVVCVVGIGLFFLYRKDPRPANPSLAETTPAETLAPKKSEPADPAQIRARLLVEYDREALAKPEAFAALTGKLDKLDAKFEDDRDWHLAVKSRRDALQRAAEKKAFEIAEQHGKSALAKIDAYDYPGAMAELDGIPAELTKTYASNRIVYYRSEIDKKAAGQVQAAIDESNSRMATKDFDGASNAFNKVAAYAEPRFASQVAMYRAEIADAKAMALAPPRAASTSFSSWEFYMGSDVYVQIGGMKKRYAIIMKAAIQGKSADVYEQADLAKYPRSAIFYYARGLAQVWDGKREEAKTSFQNAARHALPANKEMKARLLCAEGRVALMDADFETVRAKLEAAQRLGQPLNAETNFLAGYMYVVMGTIADREKKGGFSNYMDLARQSMQQASTMDPYYRVFSDWLVRGVVPEVFKKKAEEEQK